MKTHKQLYYMLYRNGYVDFAVGSCNTKPYHKSEGLIYSIRWDDDLKDYVPTLKIATNRLGR